MKEKNKKELDAYLQEVIPKIIDDTFKKYDERAKINIARILTNQTCCSIGNLQFQNMAMLPSGNIYFF